MHHPHNPWSHWAESAEQNKTVISEAIKPYVLDVKLVLELGSGTGQHAVFFSQLYPALQWQPSEHPANIAMLKENLLQHGKQNIKEAITLDAAVEHWPRIKCDLFYSANTLHIMSWTSVCQLFKHLGQQLQAEQRALTYGPFRFANRPFAESNAAFDKHLRQCDPASGIRDIDALTAEASTNGIRLEKAIEMPANNHILVWQRNLS